MSFEPLSFKEFSGSVNSKEPRVSPFAKKKSEEPPPPPPPPTFSEAELADAKRDAYQEGFLAGVKDGIAQTQSEQADIERQLLASVEKFAEEVNPIFERYKTHIKELKLNMPTLALTIAKKVAGDALLASDSEIIATVSQHCANIVFHEPKITVSVNSKFSDTLYHNLKKLHGTVPDSAHIEVAGSDDIPLGNFKIEWENGELERNIEKIWQQMEKTISAMQDAVRNEKEEQFELGIGI